jgi:hypothetical protein
MQQKLRKSVQHIREANDKHDQEMEKMVETVPDHPAGCADADSKELDEEFLRGYMAESMTSSGARLIRLRLTPAMSPFETREEFYKSCEPSKVRPTNALLDSILWQAPIVFPCSECIFFSTARSMTPRTAANRSSPFAP